MSSSKYIAQIKNSRCEKLRGVRINAKLSFEKHIERIFTKARAKLRTLVRISLSMNIEKMKFSMKKFLANTNKYNA